MTVIAVVVILAILGLVSGVSFITGSSLGGSTRPAANGGPEATATALVLQARSQADSLVRKARQESLQLLAAARAQAKRIKSSGNGHRTHHGNGASTPTPVVATPTTVPRPGPTATPTIAGAPNLSGVPAFWVIVVFGVNPQAGTLSIVNRASGTLSGRVVVTYVKRSGAVSGVRRASFAGVAGRSVAALTMARAPAHWSTYRITVTNVR